MRTYAVGRVATLGGAAVAVLGLAVALLGTLGVVGGIASLLGLVAPPIGLAIGATARRTAGDRARGDALAVFGGMSCHLFALPVAVLLAGGWLLLGSSSLLIAALAWGVAAVGYGAFAYGWDRATESDVEAVRGEWRP